MARHTFADIFGTPVSRKTVLEQISSKTETKHIFRHFSKTEQEQFVAFLAGSRGIRITYDPVFKTVFDPDVYPHRLEALLTAILGFPVRILRILPTEGIRMSETGSFVIMDIIVELADGSLITVEMQKVGYLFPGERSSCYLADALMRQYNRTRARMKKAFSYRHMNPVLLIILMEDSPALFQEAAPVYIHRRRSVYDSGIELRDLEHVIYISLDTFQKRAHNNTITNELEAWLTFLSTDDPQQIARLVESYPSFLELYADVARLRCKPEELIYMISRSLRETDRALERMMIDEWRQEIICLKKERDRQQNEMKSQQRELKSQQRELSEKDSIIAAQKKSNAEKDALIAELQRKLAAKEGD